MVRQFTGICITSEPHLILFSRIKQFCQCISMKLIYSCNVQCVRMCWSSFEMSISFGTLMNIITCMSCEVETEHCESLKEGARGTSQLNILEHQAWKSRVLNEANPGRLGKQKPVQQPGSPVSCIHVSLDSNTQVLKSGTLSYVVRLACAVFMLASKCNVYVYSQYSM